MKLDREALELAASLVKWSEDHGPIDGEEELSAIRENTLIVCKELLRVNALLDEIEAQMVPPSQEGPASVPAREAEPLSDTPLTDAIVTNYLAKCDIIYPDGSHGDDIECDLRIPVGNLERALAMAIGLLNIEAANLAARSYYQESADLYERIAEINTVKEGK
jgi:hypothetical protein